MTEFGMSFVENHGYPIPTQPIVFLKPTTSYISEDEPIVFPPGCNELNHEVELGVVIGKNGYKIPADKAANYIGGYFVALDIVAIDILRETMKKGYPWALANGFDTSTPVGEFIDKSKIPNPENLQLWLKVNGKMRQNGNTADMIFSINHLISFISQYMTLEEGDTIITGTPIGAASLKSGDVIEAGLADISQIKIYVT